MTTINGLNLESNQVYAPAQLRLIKMASGDWWIEGVSVISTFRIVAPRVEYDFDLTDPENPIFYYVIPEDVRFEWRDAEGDGTPLEPGRHDLGEGLDTIELGVDITNDYRNELINDDIFVWWVDGGTLTYVYFFGDE